MIEQQENINPNEELQLADVIRDNLNYQHEQFNKKTLMKQSLIKLSLQKDFSHLFQHQTYTLQENKINQNKNILQVAEEVKQVCQWLQQSDDFAGIAYLSYNWLPRLLQVLHQKAEGTVIVLSQYPSYWAGKMEQLGRLTKLRWAILSSSQQSQQKVKVLQLYQLKRLKLLFVTPSLFQCQQYHEFQSQLLVIPDLHLYYKHSQLLSKVINKTNPGRFLALYHTLMPQHYKGLMDSMNLKQINKPRSAMQHYITLKTTTQQKFKTFMAYLSKNDYKKILVIVDKRQQASSLNKKLLMQSKTSINLYETMSETKGWSSIQLLNRLDRDRQQQKVLQQLRKTSSCQVVISGSADYLKFSSFDLVVYYSFTNVINFVEGVFTAKQKLLLLADQDFYNLRNSITSDYLQTDILQKIVMRVVERPLKKDQNNKKRYYSDIIDDNLMDKYTVSKQVVQKDQFKVIRIQTFCRKHQISPKLLTKILQALEKHKNIQINYRTPCQVQIDPESISKLKKKLPQVQEVRRKVSLLSVSTTLQKTVKSVLEDLKREGIRFKVTEQVLQLKLLKDYEDIQWTLLSQTVNQSVTLQAQGLDQSFQTFKQCAYSSIQLTRRQRALQKKQVLINFLKNTHQDSSPNIMQSYHKSNLLTSQIEQWMRNSQQNYLSQHQLVLILQGVQKGKSYKYKQDQIFGRYRKLKYQQLMQAVTKIYSLKKIKAQ